MPGPGDQAVALFAPATVLTAFPAPEVWLKINEFQHLGDGAMPFPETRITGFVRLGPPAIETGLSVGGSDLQGNYPITNKRWPTHRDHSLVGIAAIACKGPYPLRSGN